MKGWVCFTQEYATGKINNGKFAVYLDCKLPVVWISYPGVRYVELSPRYFSVRP